MYLIAISVVITACLAMQEGTLGLDPKKCSSNENKYSHEANAEPSEEEMFKNGHLKPFGSHRPPDFYADEIPFMISPEDFYMNYVVKHKPVVLKGAAKNWPAYKLWSDEYLKQKYGNETVRMETKDDDKYNIPPNENFNAFLDKYREKNSKLYLVDEVMPRMREEVVLPLCLRCEEMDKMFFVSFLWLSGGGTMSTAHIDTDENLLCVLNGHKRTLMVSPIYSKYLYADDARVMGVCDVNTTSVDLEKFPDVTKVRYWEAIADEGDCVFIPQMWWHQVYSRKERQLAVALWWKSKPFWKDVQKSGKVGSIKLTPEQRKEKKPYSFSEALQEYEEWVYEVAPEVPRIRCREQRKFMSDYQWETDPVGNESRDDMKTRDKATNEKEHAIPCLFDETNKESPCFYKSCIDKDESACLEYTLDYCGNYEDRGCLISKPHLFMKMKKNAMDKLAEMPSKLGEQIS